MDTRQNNPAMLAVIMENVRKTAAQVRRCPACQSDRIHTALNMVYYFDHLSHEFSINSSMNLAEHGWHECRRCNHKWVSNALLQPHYRPKIEPPPKTILSTWPTIKRNPLEGPFPDKLSPIG